MTVDQIEAIYGGEKADCFGLVRPPTLAMTTQGGLLQLLCCLTMTEETDAINLLPPDLPHLP